MPSSERGSISKRLKDKYILEGEELKAAAKTVTDSIEKAYRVLKSCPQGKSSLYYFLSDLSASKEISGIVKDHPLSFENKE